MLEEEFEARVLNGQLVPAESLRHFEGQRVHVTVSAPKRTPQPAIAEAEPAPPQDLDIEKDVYVRMPLPGKVVVRPVIVQGTGLRPCLIFPEDLPDE